MEQTYGINGFVYAKMIHAASHSLKNQAKAVNDLNVFPIPDGDTGDNMLLTLQGGSNAVGEGADSVGETARRAADGMLISARGNSGVILSQFFDGIAYGLEGVETADIPALVKALKCGVDHAYNAVLEPTEGTILTVARCASDAASRSDSETPDKLLVSFITEAKSTLEKTPDMLPVLKKAGVVDSGGAGLIYIMEGMLSALTGKADFSAPVEASQTDAPSELDLSLFDENSVLEFGYCTELLLRLQNAKCDAENFDVSVITDYLATVGDSLVAFKTGTIVKIHVHTMTPDKVLSFCQQYGEFLKVKIENMSLQHNNATLDIKEEADPVGERKDYGVVAVCSGEGVRDFFLERGADVIVSGGQSMNPSTEDFLNAFRQVNADTVLVFPNNSNIILAAKQAAEMYSDSDVRVIESRNLGDGFAALSMLCTDSGDTDAIVAELTEAMQGVVTAEVSRSVRDTAESVAGDYIGFVGKDILCDSSSRLECAKQTVDKADFSMYEIMIVLFGKGVPAEEAEELKAFVEGKYSGKEVFVIDGKQDIYDYIMIME